MLTLSVEDCQELGKSYYKSKQYEKAVEAFTNGIEASVIPSSTLYDYRAASYEKLGDFSSAVRDGRLAIKTHKQDVKGYLRTASALQKMDKMETALGIYKYGMRNVPANQRDFKLLQQLHDQLTRRLSPPTAIDPLTILPVELVEMIIGDLPFREAVKCLRVSKSWKNYLTNCPNLWTTLDFSAAVRPVSRKFIGNAVRYGRDSLHTMIVHRIDHLDVIRNIATACKCLHTLKIVSLPHSASDTLVQVAESAQNLKHFSIAPLIGFDTATQILQKRPDAEHIEFNITHHAQRPTGVPSSRVWKGGPFPRLQNIKLCGQFLQSEVRALVDKAPALKSLNVTYSKTETHMDRFYVLPLQQTCLTTLILKSGCCQMTPTIPPTLQRFVFDPDDLALFTAPEGRAMVRSNALRFNSGSLIHLSLGEGTIISENFLRDLLDYCIEDGQEEGGQEGLKPIDNAQPLQHLSLARSYFLQLEELAPQGPSGLSNVVRCLLSSPRILTNSLSTLSLVGSPLKDDDIKSITELTNLSTIDVSSTELSGLGIKRLVDGSTALRHIKANHCRNLSSRDAIDYAQSKGVYVSYTLGETSKGAAKGRKVRYG